jgi:prefoldin subunit 5
MATETKVTQGVPPAEGSRNPVAVKVMKCITVEDEKSRSGIPKVRFVEDVDDFLTRNGLTLEVAFQYLNELLSKYRFMEIHMQKKKLKMKTKIPEIKRTKDVVDHLKKKLEQKESGEDASFNANFPLADSLYASAQVNPTNTVYLWLGANVMLEYNYEEATELLLANVKQAVDTLRTTESDLLFLRDQITTAEVNIARMFNYDVQRRRQANDESK